MSVWSYVMGTIEVSVPGRTQPEIEYILKTVLDHLPKVVQDRNDMDVYIQKKSGYNSLTNSDEFLKKSNLLNNGFLKTQSHYLLTVSGSFRNTEFKETLHGFSKWINRLSKRVMVQDVLVRVSGYGNDYIFTNKNDIYGSMCDYDTETLWTNYLMWDFMRDKNGNLLDGKPDNHKQNKKSSKNT